MTGIQLVLNSYYDLCMKTVLELTSQKALKFFMDAENYCSLSLPVYFNFQPVLNYVQKMVIKDDLDSYLKTAKVYPSNFDGVNYKCSSIKMGDMLSDPYR